MNTLDNDEPTMPATTPQEWEGAAFGYINSDDREKLLEVMKDNEEHEGENKHE